MPITVINGIKKIVLFFLTRSLRASNFRRGESDLKKSLEKFVPNIENQYSTFKIPPTDLFLNEKIRCQHAFQSSLMLRGLELLRNRVVGRPINVVDIGDSSVTHLTYLRSLAAESGLKIETTSVNLDPMAIKRIRDLGLKAEHCRAEELHFQKSGVVADLFMSFETLEHFFDPSSFLRAMSTKAKCSYFLVTIPFVRSSRVGLHQLRLGTGKKSFAENTHIFEFSPKDWNLLFQFTGWKVVHSDIYTQYPKFGPLNATRFIWRKFDFEGFYGVVLEQDLSKSNLYQDWPA